MLAPASTGTSSPRLESAPEMSNHGSGLPQQEAARGERALQAVLFAYVAVKLSLFVLASLRVRFVMDEMQFLSQFNDFREGLYTAVDPIKTVLAAVYFALPRLFFQDSASQLIGARVLGLLAGVMIAVLGAMTARRLYADRTMVLLVVGCLVTLRRSPSADSGFAPICYRHCSPLWDSCSRWDVDRPAVAPGGRDRGRGSIHLHAEGGIRSRGIPPCDSSHRRARNVARRVGLCLRLLAGWGAVLLIYAVALGGQGFANVVVRVFLTPRQLAFVDYQAYPGIRHFELQVLARNLVPWVVVLAGMIASARRWSVALARERWALVATSTLLVLVFAHNQPWPYVFLLAVPFSAIWTGRAVEWAGGGRRARRLGLSAVLTALFVLSVGRNLRYVLVHTNREQLALVRRAESMLAPAERYFAWVGLLPAPRSALTFPEWWWDRPRTSACARISRRVIRESSASCSQLRPSSGS